MTCCKPDKEDEVLLKPVTETGYVEDPGNNDENDKDTRLGYIFVFFGNVMHLASLASKRGLAGSMPHSELNGLRYSAECVIICPFLIIQRRCDIRISGKLIGWVLLAGLFHVSANYALYGASSYLMLGVTSGIFHSVTLTLNCTISCIIRRNMRWFALAFSIVCIVGIALAMHQEFTSSQELEPFTLANHTDEPICRIPWPGNLTNDLLLNVTSKVSDNEELAEDYLGYILCGMAAVAYVLYMQVVNLTLPSLDVFVSNFWMSLEGILVSFIVMRYTETAYWPSLPVCITLVVVHMVTSAAAVLLLYRGLQLLDPVMSTIILTLKIVFIYISLGPELQAADSIGLAGITLIILSNVAIPIKLAVDRCRNT